MKQETGSKSQLINNKVSIQLALDGHSFSVTTVPESLSVGEPAEVEVITPYTMLVPEILFAPQEAEKFFIQNGICPPDDSYYAYSDPNDGSVALMAIDRKAIQQVKAKTSEQIHFTTPLLHIPANTEQCIWISRIADLLYIKVYKEHKLHLAEVIKLPAEEELSYFLERLNQCFPFKEFKLHIAGKETKTLRKFCGNRFKQITCE